MYRLLRLFFGPIAFTIYYCATYFGYRHHVDGSMLGQLFAVCGTAWMIASFVTFIILAFTTIGKDGNKCFGIWRTIWSGLALLFFTRLTAWIWIYMDKQERSIATGLMNIGLGFLSLFTLCMILVSFVLIVNALTKEEKKKK
jgi:hypothetical protein